MFFFGTSPDFPVLGTGPYDWHGMNTDIHTEKLLGYARHPNAINQPFIVSWNNKQAPRWSAADDNYHWGAAFRAQMLMDPIAGDLKRGRKISVERLVQIMDEAATQDIRGVKLLPVLLKAVGKPGDASLAAAVPTPPDLADATARRDQIAGLGVARYEIDEPEPFVIALDHGAAAVQQLAKGADADGARGNDPDAGNGHATHRFARL